MFTKPIDYYVTADNKIKLFDHDITSHINKRLDENLFIISKVFNCNQNKFIQTTCNRIIIWNRHVPDLPMIRFDFTIKQMISTNHHIIILDFFGNMFYFKTSNLDNFALDSNTNFKLLSKLSVINISKVLFVADILVVLNKLGDVHIYENSYHLHKFSYRTSIKSNVSDVIDMYESNQCVSFLTKYGTLYTCHTNYGDFACCLCEPGKIKLNSVIAAYVEPKYGIACTIDNLLYMWGDLAAGQKAIGLDLHKGNYSYTPLLIKKID